MNTQTRILELQRRVGFVDLMAPEEFREVIHTVHNVLNRRVKDRETKEAIGATLRSCRMNTSDLATHSNG